VSVVGRGRRLGKIPVAIGAEVAGLPMALLGLFVAAVVPSSWAFAVFAAASYLAEPPALRRITGSMQPLGQVCLSVTAGSVFRGAAALVLLARLGDAGTGTFVVVAVGFLALQALRGGYAGLLLFVWWCRRLPAVTRNVDLSALRIPDAPPRLLMDLHRGPLALTDLPLVAGVALAAAGPRWAAIGTGVAVLAAVAAAGWLSWHAWGNRHLAAKGMVLRAVREQVQAYEPEVLVYFSGALESAYQLSGWLPVLDRLERRVLVVLREREMLTRLDPTSRPVVCLPLGNDLSAFKLPTARVALFVANAANNTHLLRMPDFRSVYLGHGDSDKPTSFNPFTKVYDEVWVAGPAGRERYARSGVGVADSDIVEVGRPSLSQLRTAADGSSAAPMPTVLYAPTWEGFHGDPGAATSLIGMGPEIVRTLLEREPPVRLIYRPHPLTGSLDRRARAAHAEILAMIDEANAARDTRDEFRRHVTPEQAARAARLPQLDRRLDELRRPTHGRADEAQTARDAGTPDVPPSAAWESALAEWSDAYWAAEGWWRHRVTGGSRPGLYDCFNHADLLIADVSGVVTDYLATGKQYAVANPAGLAPETFRERYPAGRAGCLIGPDLSGLGEILDQLGSAAADPLAAERLQLRAHLLGPDATDSLAAFARALDDLLARAAVGTAGP
jgi:hypothetical protein